MSTKKVRDATSKQRLSTTTRAKKPAETAKKEVSKTRTSSRIQSKPHEDEEEKVKKVIKHSSQSSDKKVSRPAPKKIVSAAKQTSSRSVTPPSSRVTKTQFFPSKKMYSLALKNDNKATSKVSSSTTKIKSTPKIAAAVNDVSPDTSSASERPRTATLRKGSIVNKNIVGPDVPKAKVPKVPVEIEEPQPDYEDDFDSYESDFDEYASSVSTGVSSDSTSSESTEELRSPFKRVGSAGTDEEKKLDSGNYELPESRHRQILDNIKESIERENANLTLDHNRSNTGSLSDEGFEDAKSLQFINFLGAQKKYQRRKSIEMRRKRGEEILSMIRLDHYSFTLFDLAPVPYDVFIKSFGRSNTVQVSVQTGEDDVNEEVQTDEINFSNKWTQYPPSFCKPEESEDFWSTYKCNYLGVGGDSMERKEGENPFSESSLEKFLLNSGSLILNLQAEANLQVNTRTDKSSMPFSKGFILFKTQSHEMLKNRPINDVYFSSNDPHKILTVHGVNNNHENSVVCLWNMSNADIPEMWLSIFGEVTCCTFSVERPNILFGGMNSGAMAIWDMNENSKSHKNVDNFENDVLTRSPTYSTEINYGHFCKIVAIQPMTSASTEKSLFSAGKATEVCSLDQNGDIIIWSVIFKEENRGRMIENQGLAHWGSVILTINNKISLSKMYSEIDDFNCTDLALSQYDSNNLYISTNYGIIIHCLASGGKPGVKKFLPDNQTPANCLEMCPFSPEYLLAGFDNGDINLYSRITEKPLLVLSNKDSLEGNSKIQKIQWSHNRPLFFYTKDITNTIHVWNLKVSDMFPVYSVPFKDNVVSMKLSPTIRDGDGASEETYMMIATDDGRIYVHLLGEGHDQQLTEEFEKDKRRFLNYINRYV